MESSGHAARFHQSVLHNRSHLGHIRWLMQKVRSMPSMGIHKSNVFVEFEDVNEPIFGSKMCFAHVFEVLPPDAPEVVERFSHRAHAELRRFARGCHDSTELFTFIPRVDELWEVRSRPGCQGPQRKCARYLSTTSWKLKMSGSRKNRLIREMEMRKKK